MIDNLDERPSDAQGSGGCRRLGDEDSLGGGQRLRTNDPGMLVSRAWRVAWNVQGGA